MANMIELEPRAYGALYEIPLMRCWVEHEREILDRSMQILWSEEQFETVLRLKQILPVSRRSLFTSYTVRDSEKLDAGSFEELVKKWLVDFQGHCLLKATAEDVAWFKAHGHIGLNDG